MDINSFNPSYLFVALRDLCRVGPHPRKCYVEMRRARIGGRLKTLNPTHVALFNELQGGEEAGRRISVSSQR